MRFGAVGLALFAALSAWAAPGPALAASNGSWAVEPTSPKLAPGATPRQYFIYELAPGSDVRDSVTITNSTRTTQVFSIYGTDGYTTASDGSLGFRSLAETQTGVGSWVKVDRSDISVPPNSKVRVPFTLRVPVTAAPGDHVGGIVALNKRVSVSEQAGSPIGVQKAVAARVYARVQGPTMVGLEVRDVRLDRSGDVPVVRYVLANVGTLRQDPTVQVTLDALVGEDQSVPPLLVRDLLPGASSEFSAPLEDLAPIDYVSVKVFAQSGTATAEGTSHTLIVPWWVWAILAALALLLIAWAVLRRRRRRRERVNTDPAETPPVETPSTTGAQA